MTTRTAIRRRCLLLASTMLSLALAFGQQPAAPAPSSPSSQQAPAAQPQAQPVPAAPPPAAANRPVLSVPAPAPLRPTLLLAYWPPNASGNPGKPFLDTIAIVVGRDLYDPWARTSDIPGEINKWIPHFDRRFFPKGREYAVYSGGQRVATAKVQRPESISCDSLSAAVKLSSRHGPARLVLAGGRPATSHPNWQRTAAGAQEQAFLQLAQEALAPHGVAANYVRLGSVTATHLEEGAPTLLLGDASGGSHRIFLIAEAQPSGGYKVQVSTVHDVGSEGSNTDAREQFLDQLDVTGDGVDEIVTISWYYESWSYNIYRRSPKGVWERYYNGGGGGC